MQYSIPYTSKRAIPLSTSNSSNSDGSKPPPSVNTNQDSIQTGASVSKLVSENSVIVFGRRGCCMCHVVKRLLLGLGANPPVVEVDEDQEAAVIGDLSAISGGGGNGGEGMQFPAVFVGGKWFGGLERVMATHISGELVPMLKQAGALWL
ncbi:glutaredoxin-C9-like [Rhododendron vialii]|uniref:glutaredoxin-C9-like n=1 Tax=Rhododendron vialii TaxID=182163 RepID=UPI00265EB231|nr:glutaredoxin-C9-like [Rhododendron vialii]